MTPVRSPSRRAAARRFSLVDDPRWERLQRAVLAAGLSAALIAGCLQMGIAEGDAAWIGWVAALAAGLVATLIAAAWPVRARPAALLRWDGTQWWWQRSGEPLAVTPHVVIDLEQWMLLRVAPSAGSAGVRGNPAVRWIALTRRALGPQWAPLRLLLFLAAA